jgi:GNAT superfamily N-acetyltransferase
VGRIAAIINDNHNIEHDDKVGFFGFFECVNDQAVASALLDAAGAWLKEHGMQQIRGPVNPSMNDEAALLVDGFDSPPQVLMTYNPTYYQALLENYGMHKVMDLFAYILQNATYQSEKMKRMVNLLRERTGITIRSMDFKNKANFKRDTAILKTIFNAAWEKNWGFVKITDDEFDFLVNDLKQVAEPSLVLIAEHQGKPVGFAITLPNINEVLIHNKKGSLLGALWHLVTKKKKISSVRIFVLGLLPEFRNKGIDTLMYAETADTAHKLGCDTGEASWILESNEAMNKALTQIMQASKYKTYRIYERDIVA